MKGLTLLLFLCVVAARASPVRLAPGRAGRAAAIQP